MSSVAASGRLAPWQRRPPPRALRGCQWPAHSVAAADGVLRSSGGSRAPWPAAARGQLLVRRRWLASPPSPRRCRGAAHRPALERRQRLTRPLHAARQTPPRGSPDPCCLPDCACLRRREEDEEGIGGKGGESDKGERERERGVGPLQIKEVKRCWRRLYCPGSSPHPGLKGTI